uniref:Neurotransmitter-gated ion-channel ligand-binding domain-containing protein n=1 Tax=Strigamia maritima TaxID=126957 RepID=T1JNS0_STRMM
MSVETSTDWPSVNSDDLSKNISNILEKLLKDYDRSQRPKSQTDEPIKVNTSMLVRSMGPISEMR